MHIPSIHSQQTGVRRRPKLSSRRFAQNSDVSVLKRMTVHPNGGQSTHSLMNGCSLALLPVINFGLGSGVWV